MNNCFHYDKETILVVAKSARLLAQYLSRVGVKVAVADCFADEDTREIADDFVKLNGLDLSSIKQAIKQLNRRQELKYLVYGSGFEPYSDSLYFLQQKFTLIGNSADVFFACQDKRRFFEQLDLLEISHPAVSFEPPLNRAGWLEKPHAGEGGLAIRYLSADPSAPNGKVYWQRLIHGQTMSALFFADEKEATIVGIQQQLHRNIGTNPFMFSGVISRPDLLQTLYPLIAPVIAKLTSAFNLQGLNSLDFIYRHPQYYVLEINPRPSASLQLYDYSWIQRHMGAKHCGISNYPKQGDSSFNAYEVIFAENDISVSTFRIWPEWIVDRPADGTIIQQNEPICSIICRENTYRQLIGSLRSRKQALDKLLNPGDQEHAIYSKC